MPSSLNEAALVWDAIEAHLAALKAPINAEIRAYPLPIPGCDAQYNHLLERRSAITGEAHRLSTMRDACRTEREAWHHIRTFLDTCPLLDGQAKAALRRQDGWAVG